MSRPPARARRLRVPCLLAIALLYLFSIPWYREADAPLRLWLGLPDWVAVALVCYVAVACLNAVAWLATEVPDHTQTVGHDESGGDAPEPATPAPEVGGSR